MELKAPSIDEFESDWLTPMQALELVPIAKPTDDAELEDYSSSCKKWIDLRLKAGKIRAAIGSTDEPTLLRRQLFADWNWSESYFWQTGDLVKKVYEDGSDDFYGDPQPSNTLQYLGVRFHPSGFLDLDSDDGAFEKATSDEMTAFSKVYIEYWKDRATQGRAHIAAKAWFFDKSVPRDGFYTAYGKVHGGQQRGRPKQAE